MWRSLAVLASLAGVAAADDAATSPDCGEGPAASVPAEARDVPINARVLLGTTRAVKGPFHLSGKAAPLPGVELPGSYLVEVDPGPLPPGAPVQLLGPGDVPVASFTTSRARDTEPPPPPRGVKVAVTSNASGLEVRFDAGAATDTAALLVMFPGTNGAPAQTYLVAPTSTLQLSQACVTRTLAPRAPLCMELVAVDLAGNRSAPVQGCQVVEVPKPAQGSAGASVPRPAGPLPPDVIVRTEPTPAPAARPSPSASSPRAYTPWLVLGLAVLAGLFGVLAQRVHAAKRYGLTRERIEIDRDALLALASRRRLRLLALAVALATGAVVVLVGASAVHPTLITLAVPLVVAALLLIAGAWRAHLTTWQLPNPDITATSDGRRYVFLSHGGELLNFAGLGRDAITRIAKPLPAARVEHAKS